MKQAISCVLGLLVAATACRADVIPTRRVEAQPAAQRALEGRLEELGLSSAEARHHVRDLTPGEAEYFARHPERVQVTGALEWSEWLLGIGGILLFAGVIFLALR
jgi:hypothetical protein